jgi:peptide/nickel transport system permease protein
MATRPTSTATASALNAPYGTATNRRFAGGARRLVARPLSVVGLFLVVGLLLISTVGRLVAPYDPIKQDYAHILAAPGISHLLGTDFLGRDVLSRLIYGAGISLFVGVAAVALALIPGVIIGVVAAYRGGWVDDVSSRVFDSLMAFPSLVLALVIVALVGPSLLSVIVAIAVTSLPFYGRLVRGQVLAVRGFEYVTAARSVGLSNSRIMFRYVLPNSIGPALVQASLGVGFAITSEASLSFLGLGVQPPDPTWGGMLSDSREYVTAAWWLWVFPGAAILTTVLAINFVGDWLRDVLDPRAPW